MKFYTDDADFEITSSLREMEEKLSWQHFSRCSNSYLVNLSKVSGARQGKVKVGPYELPLSRTYRNTFLMDLSEYIDR